MYTKMLYLFILPFPQDTSEQMCKGLEKQGVVEDEKQWKCGADFRNA